MGKKFKSGTQILITGLGNPEKKHALTFHNTGILFVDYLAKKFGDTFEKTGGKPFLFTKSPLGILVKSLVPMNNSGETVISAMKFFGISANHVIVVHDDSDILIGNYKIQKERGAAGHNGVSSVISSLHTNSFWRIRIGVRKKEEKRKKALEFVLRKIGKSELKILEQVFSEILAEISDFFPLEMSSKN